MSALAPAVKDIFRGFGIALPAGTTGRPPGSFPGDEDALQSNPEWLFKPASTLGYHARTVERVSALFIAFMNEMCEAVCASWNTWQKAVTFRNVVVNGPVGMLPPGGLVEVEQMGSSAILGRMSLAGEGEMYRRYAAAIASALEAGWKAWATGYSHPSIPFPGAATLPGPLASVPCSPVPLASGSSAGDSGMTASALASAAKSAFGMSGMHSGPLFDAFGAGIEQLFTEWKALTMLRNVLATGGAGMPVVGAVGMGGELDGPGVAAQPRDLGTTAEEPLMCQKTPESPGMPLSGVARVDRWLFEYDFLKDDSEALDTDGDGQPDGRKFDRAIADVVAVRPFGNQERWGMKLYSKIGAAKGQLGADGGGALRAEGTGAKAGASVYAGRDPFNPVGELWVKGSFLEARGALEGFAGSDGTRQGFSVAAGVTAAVIAGDVGFELNIPLPGSDETLSVRSRKTPDLLGGGGVREVHGHRNTEDGRTHVGEAVGGASWDASVGRPYDTTRRDP